MPIKTSLLPIKYVFRQNSEPIGVTEGDIWIDTSGNNVEMNNYSGLAWELIHARGSDTPEYPVEGSLWFNTNINRTQEFNNSAWVDISITNHDNLDGILTDNHHTKTSSVTELVDHTKTEHDSLGIDADTLDGEHASNMAKASDIKAVKAQLINVVFAQDLENWLYESDLRNAIPFFFTEFPSETIVNELNIHTSAKEINSNGSNYNIELSTAVGGTSYSGDHVLTDIPHLFVDSALGGTSPALSVEIDGTVVASTTGNESLYVNISGYTGTHTITISCNANSTINSWELQTNPKLELDIDSKSPVEGMIIATMVESELGVYDKTHIEAYDDSGNSVEFTSLDTSVDLSSLNILKLRLEMGSLASAIDNLGIVWS